jgi:SPP1 family predicted phage head-tail adaptor
MKAANKYNTLIEFWSVTNTPDGSGGSYSSYILDFQDYAYIITRDEQRTLQEGQIILNGFFEIYLRFRNDKIISKTHNIKFKGKSLTIHSIVNVGEQNKELKIVASESDNNTLAFENVNPYENY